MLDTRVDRSMLLRALFLLIAWHAGAVLGALVVQRRALELTDLIPFSVICLGIRYFFEMKNFSSCV